MRVHYLNYYALESHKNRTYQLVENFKGYNLVQSVLQTHVAKSLNYYFSSCFFCPAQGSVWLATVQSATPTCIWSVPASWIFTALVVTMLSGPCKAISANCFLLLLFNIFVMKSKFIILHLLFQIWTFESTRSTLVFLNLIKSHGKVVKPANSRPKKKLNPPPLREFKSNATVPYVLGHTTTRVKYLSTTRT